MILRRYGTTIQSVETNFDSKAFTEIGFRRDHAYSSPADDFLDRHERMSEHLLEAESEGDVQDEVESAMLQRLLDQLLSLDGELAEDEFVFVESEPGPGLFEDAYPAEECGRGRRESPLFLLQRVPTAEGGRVQGPTRRNHLNPFGVESVEMDGWKGMSVASKASGLLWDAVMT